MYPSKNRSKASQVIFQRFHIYDVPSTANVIKRYWLGGVWYNMELDNLVIHYPQYIPGVRF